MRADHSSYFITTLNGTKKKRREEKKIISIINYNYYSSKITYSFRLNSKKEMN